MPYHIENQFIRAIMIVVIEGNNITDFLGIIGD